jgi:hypothetical protein
MKPMSIGARTSALPPAFAAAAANVSTASRLSRDKQSMTWQVACASATGFSVKVAKNSRVSNWMLIVSDQIIDEALWLLNCAFLRQPIAS